MKHRTGFTLIEVIIVICILGILAALAVRLVDTALDRNRFERTSEEMERLVFAIVGNPSLVQGGLRSDFGYVGDCAVLPSSLDSLVTDPGATGWNGPYISNEFLQFPDDFKTDEWGTGYIYNASTGTIISYGSDSASGGTGYAEDITKKILDPIANATTNSVNVYVKDGNGTTLTSTYVGVTIDYPEGTSHNLDYNSGYFYLTGTVPIGNLKITVTPTEDYTDELGGALESIMSVYPRGPTPPSITNIRLAGTIGGGGGGGGEHQWDCLVVSYSDAFWSDPPGLPLLDKQLKGLTLSNLCANEIVIDKINISWSDPLLADEIKEIKIDGNVVWPQGGALTGSPSGTTLDIADVAISGWRENVPIDYMRFSKDLSGRTFKIAFIMGDWSPVVISFTLGE